MTSITNNHHYWEQYERMNCWYCGAQLYHNSDLYLGKRISWNSSTGERERWKQCRVAPQGWKKLAYDHVVPRSKGGNNADWNVILTCESCNCSKNNKTLEEFRQYKAKKLRTPTHYFWVEKQTHKTIECILARIHLREIEQRIYNDTRLENDYLARASQKRANVVDLMQTKQNLEAIIAKSNSINFGEDSR